MSAQEEQSTAASESNAAKRISRTSTEVSPELFKERIKANLEPLHAHITALTQMMNKLIRDNSAKAYSTANTREMYIQRPNLRSEMNPEPPEPYR